MFPLPFPPSLLSRSKRKTSSNTRGCPPSSSPPDALPSADPNSPPPRRGSLSGVASVAGAGAAFRLPSSGPAWSRDPSGLGPFCCDGKGALACFDYCFAPGVIASPNLSPSPSGQLRDFVRRVMGSIQSCFQRAREIREQHDASGAWSSTHCIRAPVTLSW